MNSNTADSPGVIALPPVIYLAFLSIGIALEYLFPVELLPDQVQYPLGVVLVIISLCIMPFVLFRFRKAGTNFDTTKPTTTIITEGPYKLTRNPAYLSMSLVYAGIAILANSIWLLGLLVPAIVVLHYGVIAREERYLENKFGAEYLRYKQSVRRWF